MFDLNSLTLKQILNTEGLPPRLIVFFASQCARDSMSKVKAKDQDPRSLTAIEVSERYGNGEDFSQDYLKKVCDDAYSAYHGAALAYSSASAALAASAASYAAYHDVLSSYASAASEIYKPLLIEIIESRLTTVEKLLIFN